MWFEKLMGFREKNPEQVRDNLIVTDNKMTSKVNGKTYTCGRLEIPTLQSLRETSTLKEGNTTQISVSEIVANVQDLHRQPGNENAVFQAASQFNLLEMVHPHVRPEAGVGIYEQDRTQGPACAIACGAGTIYRNYFVPIDNQLGQTRHKQIDCLEEIGKVLNNDTLELWEMTNGYALADKEALQVISKHIDNLNTEGYEALKAQLKIGIQWDAEVTLSDSGHTVSQAYCSALPVAYSRVHSAYWESFARLVLEATYEATFYAALKNYERTGSDKLFLTLVGGGAFGNDFNWIFDAIEHSIRKFSHVPLDVQIVSYGHSHPGVRAFVGKMNE